LDTSRDRLVRKGDYVYGSFIKPAAVDGYINGMNPGDRSDELGRFPFSQSSVDDAVKHAVRASETWRTTSQRERETAVIRFREVMLQIYDRLSSLLTRETGKPLWESRLEVHNTLRAVDAFLVDSKSWLTPVKLEEGAISERVPRGVVGVLCPYNFPVYAATIRTVAAVLSGNAVVYKPSKFTPAVGQLLAEIWDRCRMPRGIVNMVQGSGSVVGKRLVGHTDVSALLAACSFNTAMVIRRATFDRPELPIHFETGGKGIALVLDDADLDKAVSEVMIGAFLSAGQRHTSTGRVIVHKSVYEPFIEALVSRSASLSTGYGYEPDTFMGPVISEKLRSRFRKYSRALATRGHNVLLAGGNHPMPPRKGFYVTPSIHEVNWRRGSPFLNEEPPGPTLLVYRVDSVDEAVSLHNEAVFRLVCSVFTRPARIQGLLQRLNTGSVNLNRATIYSAFRLPRAGLGRSSGGRPGGLSLLDAVTYPRARIGEQPIDSVFPELPAARGEDPLESEAALDLTASMESL